MTKWYKEYQVSQLDQELSLRELLEQVWLIPKKFVHFLRIREHVQVNGSYRPMNTLVHNGDLISFQFDGDEFRTAESNYLPDASQHIVVVFENADLLVVNKPAGIKTHPNRLGETGTLMNFVAAYLADSGARPYIVHRIDSGTSGAVVVAKNPIVVPILNRLISMQKIKRTYLAVTDGQIPMVSGTIELPIGLDDQNPRKRRVNGQAAQSAVTHYQVQAANGDHSLVRLKLETGRTHQIRLHLAALGAPIVGDRLYNSTSRAPQMLLHGSELTLILPFSLIQRTIEVEIPRYFKKSIVNYNLS